MCGDVVVMYTGNVVEKNGVNFYSTTKDPYSKLLMGAIPIMDKKKQLALVFIK